MVLARVMDIAQDGHPVFTYIDPINLVNTIEGWHNLKTEEYYLFSDVTFIEVEPVISIHRLYIKSMQEPQKTKEEISAYVRQITDLSLFHKNIFIPMYDEHKRGVEIEIVKVKELTHFENLEQLFLKSHGISNN